MEEESNTAASYDQSGCGGQSEVSASRTQVEEQPIAKDQQGRRQELPVVPEPNQPLDDLTIAGGGSTRTASPWVQRQTPSSGLGEISDQRPQAQGKREQQDMSYPGDYYHSGMAVSQYGGVGAISSATNHRSDVLRSSTTSSSSASTPKQGSEEARGDKKLEAEVQYGSSNAGRGAGAGGSGSSRSRLVGGVFLRY